MPSSCFGCLSATVYWHGACLAFSVDQEENFLIKKVKVAFEAKRLSVGELYLCHEPEFVSLGSV